MRFWLNLGCLDAIRTLVEREGTNCENLPESARDPSHASFGHSVRGPDLPRRGEPAAVGRAPYFGEGDQCHMAFHFPVMPRRKIAHWQPAGIGGVCAMMSTIGVRSPFATAMYIRGMTGKWNAMWHSSPSPK